MLIVVPESAPQLVTCDFLHDKLVVIDVTGKGQRVATTSDYISRVHFWIRVVDQ